MSVDAVGNDRPQATDVASEPAPQSRLGDMRIWGLGFALVFIALTVSVAVQLSRGYYDARYIDLEQSRLTATSSGSHLHLVLRHAPGHGQLAHLVRATVTPGGLYTVVVLLSAEGTPASSKLPADRRTLEIDLPTVSAVRVRDERWARNESVVIQQRPAPGPEPSPRAGAGASS